MNVRPLSEIDTATRGAGIRRSELARLLGISRAAVGEQVRRGEYQTITIGGICLIATKSIRESFGLEH